MITNRLNIGAEDLLAFNQMLPSSLSRRLTLKKMYFDLIQDHQRMKDISFQTFYKRFISENGLVYRKPKIGHSYFNIDKKREVRILNCYIIERILSSNQTLYFYNETAIDSQMCFTKAWFMKSETRVEYVKPPIKYFPFNIVTSLSEIVSFSLTTPYFDKDLLADFHRTNSELINRKSRYSAPANILLDNGPKTEV